jgi:dTDP-4-amino-4,6-dideoxygalactose transaminase
MIYYPVPLHQQKAFEVAGMERRSLPVTEGLSEVVISLPIHTEMDDEQLGRITNCVLEFIKSQ